MRASGSARRNDVADDVRQDNRLTVQIHLPGFNLGEVEDVVDQLEEVFAASVDLVQKPMTRGRVKTPRRLVAQQL